jgi:hypothetical protein
VTWQEGRNQTYQPAHRDASYTLNPHCSPSKDNSWNDLSHLHSTFPWDLTLPPPSSLAPVTQTIEVQYRVNDVDGHF